MSIFDTINKNVSKLVGKATGGEATLATPFNPMEALERNLQKSPLRMEARETPLTMTPTDVSQRIARGIEKLKQTSTILGTAKEFAKGAGQSIARSLAAIGTAKEALQRGQDPFKAEFVPTSDLSKRILGTEEAISFENIGREVASIVGKGQTISGNMAIPLGLVFAGLDVLPITSGKAKATYQAIAKTNVIDDIFKLVKPLLKGSDDDIRALAIGLKDVSDPKVVEQLITKVKNTPLKTLQPLTQEARKGLDALKVEARKYKTADEFGVANHIAGTTIGKGMSKEVFVGHATREGIGSINLKGITNESPAKFYDNWSGYLKTLKEGKYDIRYDDFYTQATKGVDLAQEVRKFTEPLAKTTKAIDEQIHYKIRETSQAEIDSVINKLKSGDTIKVYRAGEEGIVAGSRVSPFKNIVEDYTHRGKITSQEVKVSDLLVEKDSGHLIYKAPKDFQPDFYTQATKGVGKVAPKITPRERGFITSVKEAYPSLEKKVAGQYIPRSTDKLAVRAKNLIKTDFKEAERIALQNTDDNAVATAAEIIKQQNELATKAIDEATKLTHYDKAAEIANTIAPKLTEQGRSIQAASILGRMTPEGQLRFAARTIQKYNEGVKEVARIPELTAEQTKMILEKANKMYKMEDGVGKAMVYKELQDDIADLVPSPWYRKVINVWKAGLLTGIKTSGLNVGSTLSHGITEISKDFPAAGVDKVASLFTGERTLAFTTRGYKEGFLQEGFEKGWRYLKTGFDERNIAPKLDWKRVNYGDSKFAKGIQAYEQSIFRALGAEDQPFYYGAKARSLASQAIAQGKNNKLKGQDLKNFVNRLIENPTDEMLKYANLDAEVAVFQNRTTLGEAAKKAQEVGKGLGEIVVPFGRTPAAVATQMINYTPVGIVKEMFKMIGKGKFDQRLFSQAMGRGITGTGIMAIGSYLFTKGLMTLDFPQTEKEQEQWKLEGKKPNSIKIGDKWRSIMVLGPAGLVALIGGHFKRGVDDTGSAWGGLTQATGGAAKSLTEQTFLQGINQAVGVLNEPNRIEGYFNRTIGSVVPTIVSDVARSVDTKERRIESPLESLFSRLPVARQTLAPQVDVLGSEIERGGNFVETMIDPSRPSKIKSSPVIDEMKRLWDLGYRVAPTKLGDKKGYKSLTQEQNTKLWKFTGTLLEHKLENLFADENYQKLSDDDKETIIGNFVEKSRLYSRVGAVLEVTEGLSGQALKEKLSELKEDGLLTKTVFEEYRNIR
uniref:Putative structural protein n=1 Tax=viral metagenome TaxID=1070528 RepID=A0A6H1ZF52_9ZZZZ